MSRVLWLCLKSVQFPLRSACATTLAAFIVSLVIIRSTHWLPLTGFDWLKEQLPGINHAVERHSHCNPNITTAILVGYSMVFVFGLLFSLAAVVGAPAYHGLLLRSARSGGGQLAHMARTSLYIWRGSTLFLVAVALVWAFWLSGGSSDIHDRLACETLRPDYVQLMVTDFFGFLAGYFIARAVKDVTLLTYEIGVRVRSRSE